MFKFKKEKKEVLTEEVVVSNVLDVVEVESEAVVEVIKEEVVIDSSKDLLKEAADIISQYLKGYSNTPKAKEWMKRYKGE